MNKINVTLAIIVSMTLAGCANNASDENIGYYQEKFTNEAPHKSLDAVFENELSYEQVFKNDPRKEVLNEGRFNQIELLELQERGVDTSVIDDNVVHFDFDSYELSEKAKHVIEKQVTLLKEVVDLKAILEGHTDRRGDRSYNLKLGEKRALAVKKYAEELGIPSDQIEVISYGEEKLLSQLDDKAAHRQNRRAEFVYK